MTTAKKPAKRTAAKKKTDGFTAEELAAMKDHAAEVRRRGKPGADEEPAVLAKIAALPEPDRGMAERVHAIVKKAAPHLTSRTYYGMPAYAKDGQVICWFKGASKFKTRFATIGFSDKAQLDDGAMWATEFAVTKLTGAVEKEIAALVKKAAG